MPLTIAVSITLTTHSHYLSRFQSAVTHVCDLHIELHWIQINGYTSLDNYKTSILKALN